MKQAGMRKKSIFDYRAVVFDLDGTLYFQKPFRIRMLFCLIGSILRRPSAFKDMFLLKEYRKIRENWDEREADGIGRQLPSDLSLEEKQFAYVARVKRSTPEKVRRAVQIFMLDAPLKLLPAYRDETLYRLIKTLRQKNIPTAVYSDYPAKEKLASLGIETERVFTAADEEIAAMKPDPKGLAYIAKELACSPDELLMIGDRYEKDGLAAAQNGIDYLILPASKKKRKDLVR